MLASNRFVLHSRRIVEPHHQQRYFVARLSISVAYLWNRDIPVAIASKKCLQDTVHASIACEDKGFILQMFLVVKQRHSTFV